MMPRPNNHNNHNNSRGYAFPSVVPPLHNNTTNTTSNNTSDPAIHTSIPPNPIHSLIN